MSDLSSNQIKNTDSDEEKDDDGAVDNYEDFIDFVSTPTECKNGFQDIYYDACPTFFMGSLRDACQAAFGPSLVHERRPILVYIHNDEGLFEKKFYETMFYSNAIISYLNMNYVVWPWDITFESNRYILTKMWEDMFSIQFFGEFSIEKCPLLIRIMPLFEYKRDGAIISEYQFKSLVKDNLLTPTQETVNCDNLLNELDIFKKKFDTNEQDLSFKFIEKAGLCWEIIFQIAQYLSINDAVSAFSIGILFLFNNLRSRFQLTNPWDPFTKIILSKIKFEQIVSLNLDASLLDSTTRLAFLSNFTEVISLTVQNPTYFYPIKKCIKCLPNLTRLSLCFDDQVNYNTLNGELYQLQQQIKRLDIHCPGIYYTDYSSNESSDRSTITTEIEYFLLDIRRYPLTSVYKRRQDYQTCYLIERIGFMSKMSNIRQIYFIIKKCDIRYFLNEKQWKILVNICSKLKKITLEVSGNIFEEEQILTKKILEIQTKLRDIRQTIKFQIRFL